MRFLKFAAGGFVAIAAMLGVAFAHVGLKTSSIPAGAIVESLPEFLTVEFSQPVGLASFAIETDKGEGVKGDPIALGYTPPKKLLAKFDIPLPRLEPGAYVAKWRIISKDGHAMAGEIRFTLAAPKKP